MLTEKDYCDYETCVSLRELGFTLDMTEKVYERNLMTNRYETTPKPLLYEAQKWLREEKDIHIEVFFSLMDDKRQLHYDWHIVHNIRFDDDEYTYDCDVLDSMGSYKSYEEALSEGIKKAVKILKEV